jgi:uncharacterized protein (TIGR03083 family)
MSSGGDDPVVALQIAEWEELAALLVQLDDADWATPTELPGWTVKDCVGHVTGTERQMMGDPAPVVGIDHLAHVRNPFGEIVEVWVEERRPWSVAQVRAEFDEQIARRVAMLRATPAHELDEVGAWPLGEMSYRDFLKVRVFDCWMHEQDIRRAVARPGNLEGPIVDVALERFEGALGYVVGKRAGAPDGSTVVFDLLDGPRRAIAVEVDGRAKVVPDAPSEPTVRLAMPFETFVAMGGGRRFVADLAPDEVRIEGDTALGQQVLQALAFTP